MSELYKPSQEKPEDKEEFERQLANTSSKAKFDRLIKDKAHDILEDLKSERQVELQNRVEPEIEQAISPRLKSNFDSSNSYTILNELSTGDLALDKQEIITIILDKINIKLSEINRGIEAIISSRNFNMRETNKNNDLVNLLSTIQNELTMLKQQLESQLDNGLDLEGTPIQDALDQYRRFESKLESLPDDSLERADIERVLAIYSEYIKQEFEQSPEKYSIGKSQPLSVDIDKIVDEFIEPNDLTPEYKSHQNNITETRRNITIELSQTPGVLGVIPMAGETKGSKTFDIIAITLKPNITLSPEEINTALKLLYSQIKTSANSKKAEIEANILDHNNIEIYTNGKPLADFTGDNQPNSELNPSQIFQLHRVKVAKRSTDFKHKKEYADHAMAMARPAQDLDDNNNIPTLTNSYTTHEGTHLILAPFNRAIFQLSAQQALGLDLA